LLRRAPEIGKIKNKNRGKYLGNLALFGRSVTAFLGIKY
jgi:hypothetical protein